jgi:hypothetical protein
MQSLQVEALGNPASRWRQMLEDPNPAQLNTAHWLVFLAPKGVILMVKSIDLASQDGHV